MIRKLVRFAAAALSAGALAGACGCAQKGLEAARPPLLALRRVPAAAVVEPAELTCQELWLDAATSNYRPTATPVRLDWLNADRLTDVCRQYVADAALFQEVGGKPPRDRGSLYLTVRPRVTVRQYARPSLRGTALAVSTVLIYSAST